MNGGLDTLVAEALPGLAEAFSRALERTLAPAGELEALRRKRTLRAREVAHLYGVEEGTLANWRSKRTGPRYVQVSGNMILYRQEDLEEFFSALVQHTRDQR